MSDDDAIERRRKQASWPREERKRKPANLTFPPEKLARWREHAAAANLPLARWLELAADAYESAATGSMSPGTLAAPPARCPPP
jgi:hypothetical protein